MSNNLKPQFQAAVTVPSDASILSNKSVQPKQLPQTPNTQIYSTVISTNKKTDNSIMSTPPPPQPPQRSILRSTIVRTNSNSSGNETTPVTTSTNSNQSRLNVNHIQTHTPSNGDQASTNNTKQTTHHETASSEAAKLVHKSAMVGSIQSLNKPNMVPVQEPIQNSQFGSDSTNKKNHTRNFSVISLRFFYPDDR